MDGQRSKVADVRAKLLAFVDGLREGDPLPPERELAASWGVARMTLRRAVDDLILDELLVRRHGAGTYVTRPKMARQLAMTSFSEEMRRRGLRPGSRTLALRRMRAGTQTGRRLRIPSTDQVVRFVRLRLADGQPMAVETTVIPARLVPGIGAADLDGSWYQLLRARYGIEVVTGTSSIEPALPDERTASQLGIPTDQACFLVHTTSRDGHGHVIEIGSSFYRGDRYTLTAELRPRLTPSTQRRRRPA